MNIFKPLVDTFEHFLLRYMPYDASIHIKDGLTFFSGIILGLCLCFSIMSYAWLTSRVKYKNLDDEDVVAIRFVKDNRLVTYIEPPKRFIDSFNIVLALLSLGHKKQDTVYFRELRKIKIIFIILVVISCLSLLIGIMFISVLEMPPK